MDDYEVTNGPSDNNGLDGFDFLQDLHNGTNSDLYCVGEAIEWEDGTDLDFDFALTLAETEKEMMRQVELMIKEDERIARELFESEKAALEKSKAILETDEEFARNLALRGSDGFKDQPGDTTDEDFKLALQLEKELQSTQLKDAEIARQLVKDELARARKAKIDEANDAEFARSLAMENQDEEYAKKLELELKDEQMARNLQIQLENEQRKSATKEDAAFARLIYEEQKLEQEKRKKQNEENDIKFALKLQLELEQQELERKSIELAKKLENEEKMKKPKVVPFVPPPEVSHKFDVGDWEANEEFFPNSWKDEWEKTSCMVKEIERKFHEQLKKFSRTATFKKITKADLSTRFEKTWATYLKTYGKKGANPVIAYHGTRAANLASIEKRGLLVPGAASGVKVTTDEGWYGKGIYLSPNLEYSKAYCEGNQLIVCAVLRGKVFTCPGPGKVFTCPGLMVGAPLKHGYDSHESPDGQEFILFEPGQILPIFIIQFNKK